MRVAKLTCPSCGGDPGASDRHCAHCGARLVVVDDNRHTVVHADDVEYCAICGLAVKKADSFRCKGPCKREYLCRGHLAEKGLCEDCFRPEAERRREATAAEAKQQREAAAARREAAAAQARREEEARKLKRLGVGLLKAVLLTGLVYLGATEGRAWVEGQMEEGRRSAIEKKREHAARLAAQKILPGRYLFSWSNTHRNVVFSKRGGMMKSSSFSGGADDDIEAYLLLQPNGTGKLLYSGGPDRIALKPVALGKWEGLMTEPDGDLIKCSLEAR